MHLSRKLWLSLSLIFLLSQAPAQNISIEGKVINAQTQKPLPFVNITINGGQYGGTSDIDGKFRISVKNIQEVRSVVFSYVGFETFTYQVDSPEDLKPLYQPLEIKLRERSESLEEVLIQAGENPAHRIIRAAQKNRRKNNPERIASFQYQAYHKFYMTLAGEEEEETLRPNPDSVIVETLDSNEVRFLGYVEDHHLFLSESVTKREYIAPNVDKETVLAHRVSGFKRPGFMSAAASFEPFSFYEDYIEILDVPYLNPISKGSTDKYFFAIEDTAYSRFDTVYVISFTPYPNKNFNAMEGLLYINTNRYALQNVMASTLDSDALLQFKIEQKYDWIDEQYWFPSQIYAQVFFNEWKVDDRRIKGVFRNYIQDIEMKPALKKRNFDEVTLEVSPQADQRTDDYWQQYRVEKLERKDLQTYDFLDSLGKKLNFNRMVTISEAFTYQRVPIGWVDLDLSSLLKINRFEGVRIGAGFYTNHRLSQLFTLGAYGAYGTKDGRFKYGGSADFSLQKRWDLNLGLAYQDDVREPGQTFFLEESPLLFNRVIRQVLTERMDRVQQFQSHIGFRPLRNTEMRLGYHRQQIEPLYNYQFLESPLNGELPSANNTFDFSEFSLQLHYAKGQEYVRVGGRKLFVEEKTPSISFNYTRGEEILGGNFTYQRWEAQLRQHIRWRSLGTTSLFLVGGWIDGDVPYPILYNGRGSTRQMLLQIDDYFQTMELYEFLSDRFVNLFLTHNFGRLLYNSSSRVFKPELVLAHSMGWGSLDQPEQHQMISFKTMDQGYYESGFMIDNLLRVNYNVAYLGFGLGTYFRYGSYANDNLWDNTFFRIRSTVSFR